jgi:hypothetical protein
MALVPTRDGTRAGRAVRQGRTAPSRLLGAIGYGVHGLAFLALAGLSLWHFGNGLVAVAAVLAVLALMSLREAWLAARRARQ